MHKNFHSSLQNAIRYQQPEKLKILLRACKNQEAINAQDENGKTLLYYAIEDNDTVIELCHILLQHGKAGARSQKKEQHMALVKAKIKCENPEMQNFSFPEVNTHAITTNCAIL